MRFYWAYIIECCIFQIMHAVFINYFIILLYQTIQFKSHVLPFIFFFTFEFVYQQKKPEGKEGEPGSELVIGGTIRQRITSCFTVLVSTSGRHATGRSQQHGCR
jgi:hypothetical protein